MLPGFLGKTAAQMGEAWFRSATRDDLRKLALRAAALDRDRAADAAALLVWSLSGNEVSVGALPASTLGALVLAEDAELDAFAARLTSYDAGKARVLLNGLQTALDEHEKAFRAWLKTSG